MQETLIDARNIYPFTDFLRNYKAHIKRIKECGSPEVLTVNGKAEVVVLDADSYQRLVDRILNADEIDRARSSFSRVKAASPQREPLSEDEIERRLKLLDEMVAETERMGLYK